MAAVSCVVQLSFDNECHSDLSAASRRKIGLLYTSDAADDLIGVDLGRLRIVIKKT